MKLSQIFLIALSTILLSVFASDIFADEFYPAYDCVSSCEHASYEIGNIGHNDACFEIQKCTQVEWNQDLNTCNIVGYEARKNVIPCIDLPPVY